MNLRERSLFDVGGGLLLAVCGLLVALQSIAYPLGKITRMGPGFFPLIAGVLLFLLGAAIALFTTELQKQDVPTHVRAAFAVFGSILAWALLLDRFGLIPATLALVAIGSLAHPRPNLRRVALTAVLLPVIGWGLFVYALGLPVAAFSW